MNYRVIKWKIYDGTPVASSFYRGPFGCYRHLETVNTGNGHEEAMAGDEYSFHNGGGPTVEDDKKMVLKAYMHELKDVVHIMSPFFKDMIRDSIIDGR